jgi:hypothetical protein
VRLTELRGWTDVAAAVPAKRAHSLSAHPRAANLKSRQKKKKRKKKKEEEKKRLLQMIASLRFPSQHEQSLEKRMRKMTKYLRNKKQRKTRSRMRSKLSLGQRMLRMGQRSKMMMMTMMKAVASARSSHRTRPM